MNKRLVDLKKLVLGVSSALSFEAPKTYVKFKNEIHELIGGNGTLLNKFEEKGKTLMDLNGNFILWIDVDKHQNFEEFITVFHELWHVHQLKKLDHNELEQLKNNYVGANNKKHNEQELEIEANLFACLVAQALFGLNVRVSIGSVPVERVDELAEKIEDFIIDNEIIKKINFAAQLDFKKYKHEILASALKKAR